MVAFVDAEIIRPRSWILANGLCAGRMLPLNLPELEVSGLALVTAIDDCPPIASSKIISGGCFIEGTIVTVSSLPGRSSPTDSLWSDPSWLDEPSRETPWLAPERYASVATRSHLQVPIESVPIGARVPTKNPNRFEVDPQPEPDQATWAKVSITVERSDGGIVDAQIIRPRSWILKSGLCAGRMLPLNLPELEASGLALVTAIDDCPPIAGGEGSVVTARFVTREVHVVASVDVLGADGTVETITGTTIHPVWSVDRQSWVPLAELTDGETLQGLDGLAVVLSVSLSRVTQPVYNIEFHGEHVYQVGELGLVVHNTCPVKGLGDIGSHLPMASRDALKHGIKWLGTGYKEIAPGVFRSADGLRQFRMTAADLLGFHGKVCPHVHIEALNKFGKVIENLHLLIF